MDLTQAPYKILLEKIEAFLGEDASGHDVHHCIRVFRLAKKLQDSEGGDAVVIGCTALAHDIMRPWEKETGKAHFGDEALIEIEKLLVKSNVPSEKIPPILEVIKHHDMYEWKEKFPKSLELQVVQDADRLDAIGAMGIARTFAFGGVYGRPMYIEGEKLTFDVAFKENPNHRTSTIAHFYEKLLKLKDDMNTPTGKKLAEARHTIMENFLTEFFKEWHGTE